jgi:hypothetical protein
MLALRMVGVGDPNVDKHSSDPTPKHTEIR